MALFKGKDETSGNAILITHRGIFSQLANSGLLTIVDNICGDNYS